MITWIDEVDISVSTAGAWTDKDLSAYIPVGATGVIVSLGSGILSSRNVSVRKNGSTDSHVGRNGCRINQGKRMMIVGVDANRVIEEYIANTTSDPVKIWLVGYTEAETVLFTNGVEKTASGYDSWVDVDVSGQITAGDTAIGGIFELYNDSTNDYYFGLRCNGSTDNRTNYTDINNTNGVITKLASNICELYSDASQLKLYMLGYFKDTANIVLNTNATNISLGTTGSYVDITTSGASGLFVEVISTGDYKYALRKNGTSDDFYRLVQHHFWTGVQCDASEIVEGKIENGGVDFFLTAYTTGGVITFIPKVMAIM